MEKIADEFYGSPKVAAEFDEMLESAPPLRWGIMGAGGIASLFARQVLQSDGQISAVASRSKAKAEEFRARFGSGRYGSAGFGAVPAGAQQSGGGLIAQAFGSYEELIASSDVDAIYIATPHSEHAQWALKALEGGKPLLIEKAIAQNTAQAKEIFAKAREKNLFVMEAMWTRFLPHIRRVKQIVESGEIGDVVALFADHGQYMAGRSLEHRIFNPDLAGGALLDLGVYPVSFAQYILGRPSKILSSGFAAPTGVDANLGCIFEYPGGVQAVLHTTSIAQTPTSAAICGTKGRIEIHTPFYRPSNFSVILNDGSRYEYTGKTERDALFGRDGTFGMQFEAAEVARCIAQGKLESETMPWSDSLAVMEMMDEIRGQLDFKFPGETD